MLLKGLVNFLILGQYKIVREVLNWALWLQIFYFWSRTQLIGDGERVRRVQSIHLVRFWRLEFRRSRSWSLILRVHILAKPPEVCFQLFQIFLNFWQLAICFWWVLIQELLKIESLLVSRLIEFVSLLIRRFELVQKQLWIFLVLSLKFKA